jgi:methylated-DNA-protein-cysteine methyltransferase-like protein
VESVENKSARKNIHKPPGFYRMRSAGLQRAKLKLVLSSLTAFRSRQLRLTFFNAYISLPHAVTMVAIFARPRKVSWDGVYRLVKHIPRGRVLSYGALARLLRLPGGARTAGRAMAGTPSGQGIPWHRVVGERGKILIREPYASLQKKLLESEGVKIIESRVDYKRHLWSPKPKAQPKSSAAKNNRRQRTKP